jgi:hypothetical protein
MTLTPAYGKDYKSQAEVKEAFDANKDFKIASVGPYAGRYVTKRELPAGTSVTLRYAKLSKALPVTV